MPLYVIPAEEAIKSRKTNPHGGWDARGAGNRVEPVARPSFAVPFKLKAGERIFTIGSCFARNIELELLARGFDLPMRSLFGAAGPLARIDPSVVNNYGVASIYNELTWGLEGGFRAEDHILPVRGGHVDIHLSPILRPAPFEVVAARREAVGRATASVKDCSVVIMTLGLVECWFDTKTGYYLNVSPRPSFTSDYPDRFELHVLSFEEVYGFLDRALDLLRRHNPAQHVILTVSPVPLTRTHRNEDVMVANAYSKAVLRAAVETALARHPQTVYYPAFESVTLSDRKVAWKDDQTHVTEEIVAMNVGRMVDAYVGDSGLERTAAEIEAGGESVALSKAENGNAAFFQAFEHLGARWPSFALAHAKFLVGVEAQKSLRILDDIPSDYNPLAVAEVRHDALCRLRRFAEAAQALEDAMTPSMRTLHLWEKLIRAWTYARDPARADQAAQAYATALPIHRNRIPYLRGRFLETIDPARAAGFFEEVCASPMSPDYMVEYAKGFLGRTTPQAQPAH